MRGTAWKNHSTGVVGFFRTSLMNWVGDWISMLKTEFIKEEFGTIGFDGIWRCPEESEVIVESKTTDAYSVSLDTLGA
jgi:hypothetical protein